jgi:hypothetical protein
MATPGIVEFLIFDAWGRQVKMLSAGRREEGPCSIVWDGTDDTNSPLCSGVYLARLVLDGSAYGSRKLILRR